MWLTIKEYAEKEKIGIPAVWKRIRNDHISKDRIRKNDGGKTEIKERDS